MSTQNPVDLDYKALSNAGTWFIGKLQTEKDKERLLDGLEGASPGLNRRHYDDLISTLDKRVFLLHNIHEKEPVPFQTRWAMNYLAGPLTRAQLPDLNKLVGATFTPAAAPTPKQEPRTPSDVDPAPQASTPPPSTPESAQDAQPGSTTRPSFTTTAGTSTKPPSPAHSSSVSRASSGIPSTAPRSSASSGTLRRRNP